MQNKGQVSLEIMAIVVVLLGLLLATSYLMMERNSEINRLATIQRDSQKCDNIVSKIVSISSNSGYNEAIVTGLEKNVRIEKGSAKVGDIYCSYKGDVWMGAFEANDTGFNLESGKSYKVKKEGEKVVFEEV